MKLLLKLALVFFLCAAQAEVAVPPLKAHVTDLTGTLSADERTALEKGLQALESRNGSQIAVLMVPTTQPETIEQYSMRVAEAWKLGKKGVDNGLLLLVAKDDRKVRIEVGYGLEGVIPDVVAHRIIDEVITPAFKDGEYMRGLAVGLFRLEALIAETSQPAGTGATVTGGMEIPHLDSYFFDLTNTISGDQFYSLREGLLEYWKAHSISILVMVVPTSQPETVAQLAARTLNTWGIRDGLNDKNSVLLLVSQKEHSAQIVVGENFKQAITDEASAVVVGAIQPMLEKGDLHGAVQYGIQQIQALLVNQKIPLSDRIIDTLYELPTWLIVSLIVIGTVLRWFMGPVPGGLTMGAVVGSGAWFVFKAIDVALFAGFAALVFVLVGVMNWIQLLMSSSSSGGGSGSGGGFSGGGGGFGGGGASGSW